MKESLFKRIVLLGVLLAPAIIPAVVEANIYEPACTPETLRQRVIHEAIQQFPDKTITTTKIVKYYNQYNTIKFWTT